MYDWVNSITAREDRWTAKQDEERRRMEEEQEAARRIYEVELEKIHEILMSDD